MSYLADLTANLADAELLNPRMLWLAAPCAVLLLVALIQRRRPMWVTLLRAITLSLLVLALAEPAKQDQHSTHELAAAIDVSASVSKTGRTELVRSLQPFLKEGTTVNLVPFGRQAGKDSIPLTASMSESSILASINQAASTVDTGETNIGSGLSNAISRSASSSVLLLSDGFETLGNSADVARIALQRGVRIFPLVPDIKAFQKRRLNLSLLHAPTTANAGDLVEVRATIKNEFADSAKGQLELWLDQEKLFSQLVSVNGGQEKLIVVKTPPTKGGLHRLRAVLRPEKTGDESGEPIENHRWIAVKERAKILLISGSKEDQSLLKQLITLKGYGLEDVIADGSSQIPQSLEGFSSVILNNAANQQLPKGFLSTLEAFVKEGGGLLIVGGDHSYGLGNYINTPLETISPVKFVPPQTEKRRLTNAVVLVIDKSGSMAEEDKIGSAKKAALVSIDAMKDDDFISVIGFDSDPFVIIDVKTVRDAKKEAPYRLQNLTAAGKTNLLPALAIARQRLQKAGSSSMKHIIVLSDGKFPLSSDAYVSEINELRKEGISVSAVALGIEADVPFMKILAKYGKGAFYQTLDPQQLPQIFVQDIKVSSGERTLNENQDYPVGVGPDGTRNTTVERFPYLRGFVETLPKPGASLELVTRKETQTFPMLASWEYGAGKVVAFTSDANGRWSLPWVRWPDFAKFWSQLIESVKDRTGVKSGDVDFDLRYSVNRKAIAFDLAIYDDKLRSELSPKVTAQVVEPGNETRQLVFRSVKKGRFIGTIDNGRPGDYHLNITYGKLKLPALAITLGGEAFGEVAGRGLDVKVLEDIAYLSGGAINPSPEQISGLEKINKRSQPLAPPLLFLAFLLIIIEALLRERRLHLARFKTGTTKAQRKKVVMIKNVPPGRPKGNYGKQAGAIRNNFAGRK